MQILSNSWLSQLLDYNDFLDDGTDKEMYKHVNRTILDSNVMNMSLIITEGKYGAIDTDEYSYHGYYIIRFYSFTYTLQADLSIYGQVISSGEMVCKGNYFFSINSNSQYYVLQRTKSINTFFL